MFSTKARAGDEPLAMGRAEAFALPAAVLSGWKAVLNTTAPPLQSFICSNRAEGKSE